MKPLKPINSIQESFLTILSEDYKNVSHKDANYFDSIFEEVLIESNPENRIQYLLKQYGSKLENKSEDPEEMIRRIVLEIDPTKGNYSEWILKNYLKLRGTQGLRFWTEDYYKTKDDLEFYDKNKKLFKNIGKPEYQDINRIKPTADSPNAFTNLSRVIKLIDTEVEKEEEKKSLKASEKDVEKIYESKYYLVLIPKTEEASCAYGRGTRWCTAANKSKNMFEEYNRKGSIYILIDKETDDKFQFHFQTDQYMDAENEQIPDLNQFFEEHSEVKPLFVDLAVKNGDDYFVLEVDPSKYIDKLKDQPENNIAKYLADSAQLTFEWILRDPQLVNRLQQTFYRDMKGIFVLVDDWDDLNIFVDRRDRDVLKSILSYDYYEEYSYEFQYEQDYWEWLDAKAFQKVKEFLEDRYEIPISDIEDAKDLVEEKDDQDIKDVLTNAMNEVARQKLESAYIKAAKEPIIEVLGEPEWFVSPYNKRNVLKFGPLPEYKIRNIFKEMRVYDTEPRLNDFLNDYAHTLEESGELERANLDDVYDYPTISEDSDEFNEYILNNLY